MTTQQSTQEKAQYFAQYYGQWVFRHPSIRNGGSIQFKGRALENGYLELKPLSSITDEHIIECAKIFSGCPNISIQSKGHYQVTCDLDFSGWHGIFKILYDKPSPIYYTNCINAYHLAVFDFLRSKSYALPWRQYSVEQLIEMGWLKLIENGK